MLRPGKEGGNERRVCTNLFSGGGDERGLALARIANRDRALSGSGPGTVGADVNG